MKDFKIRFCAFLFLFCAFLCFVTPVRAASFSLGVFPPILEIIARPGTEVKAKLRIYNFADPASVKIYFQEFKPGDEMGNIELLSKNENTDEVLNWASLESKGEIFPGELNLGAKEARDFSLIFKIPKNAKEDDHYLTIFFESIPFAKITETHAKAQARIGANILLTVSERTIIPKYGEIVEFSSPKFVESGPVKFTLRVKNNGRTFFKPIGSIKVYNILMKETGEVEILPQNVLAGSVRALTDKSILAVMKEQEKKVLGAKQVANSKQQVISKIKSLFPFLFPNTSYSIPNTTTPTLLFPQTFLLGRYTAVAQFTLDENGPTLTAKTTFYAFPLRLALAILITLFLLSLIKKRLKS